MFWQNHDALHIATFAIALTAAGCGPSTPPKPEPSAGASSSPPAQSPSVPVPPARPARVVYSLKGGTVFSIIEPDGFANVPSPPAKTLSSQHRGVEFKVSETTVAPKTATAFVSAHGGTVLERRTGSGVVAYAVEVHSPSLDRLSNEVYAWQPGLTCRALDVPSGYVSTVLDLCASLRREGGVLDHGTPLDVYEEKVLGLPAVSINAGQFGASRMTQGAGVSCEDYLTMADYKHVTSRQKTMTLQHGEVQTWWSVPEHDTTGLGRSKVFATRGEYCCAAETQRWYEPASGDDLYAMAKLCDAAAEPGWPTDFLPPQRTTIAPARRSD